VRDQQRPDPGPGNGTDLVIVPVELNVVTGTNRRSAWSRRWDCAGRVRHDEHDHGGGRHDRVLLLQVTNTGDVTFTTHDLVDDQLGGLLTGFGYTLNPEPATP